MAVQKKRRLRLKLGDRVKRVPHTYSVLQVTHLLEATVVEAPQGGNGIWGVVFDTIPEDTQYYARPELYLVRRGSEHRNFERRRA